MVDAGAGYLRSSVEAREGARAERLEAGGVHEDTGDAWSGCIENCRKLGTRDWS